MSVFIRTSLRKYWFEGLRRPKFSMACNNFKWSVHAHILNNQLIELLVTCMTTLPCSVGFLHFCSNFVSLRSFSIKFYASITRNFFPHCTYLPLILNFLGPQINKLLIMAQDRLD